MTTLNQILLQSTTSLTLLTGVGIFLLITLVLVIILLIAKKYLVNTGNVTITINNDKTVEASSGKSLLSTMADNNIFLPLGLRRQRQLRPVQGQGRRSAAARYLPTETVHFTRKEIKEGWRLGCQLKVKGDLKIDVPASVLDVKEWECEVISNRNVATFIKEFIVKLPEGEHMNFIPGSYAQIKIPAFSMDYDRDIDKSLIGPSICRHGKNSASSRSNAKTKIRQSAPTPWPTIRPRATASC